jgi:hypothetical protein
MATFVLVHGSWAGNVVWRELAPRLRKAGHDVYAPTLTGIGARKHLLSREGNRLNKDCPFSGTKASR